MHAYTAKRIKDRLMEMERTQAWLARKLGLTQATISRWLNGNAPWPMSPRRLPQIAEVLGLTVEDLTEQEIAA